MTSSNNLARYLTVSCAECFLSLSRSSAMCSPGYKPLMRYIRVRIMFLNKWAVIRLSNILRSTLPRQLKVANTWNLPPLFITFLCFSVKMCDFANFEFFFYQVLCLSILLVHTLISSRQNTFLQIKLLLMYLWQNSTRVVMFSRVRPTFPYS